MWGDMVQRWVGLRLGGVRVGWVEMYVECVGSVVGIARVGIGVNCGSCGSGQGESHVLLRFHSFSVVSVAWASDL